MYTNKVNSIFIFCTLHFFELVVPAHLKLCPTHETPKILVKNINICIYPIGLISIKYKWPIITQWTFTINFEKVDSWF